MFPVFLVYDVIGNVLLPFFSSVTVLCLLVYGSLRFGIFPNKKQYIKSFQYLGLVFLCIAVILFLFYGYLKAVLNMTSDCYSLETQQMTNCY